MLCKPYAQLAVLLGLLLAIYHTGRAASHVLDLLYAPTDTFKCSAKMTHVTSSIFGRQAVDSSRTRYSKKLGGDDHLLIYRNANSIYSELI